MHEQPAYRVLAHASLNIPPGISLAEHPDGLGAVALPGKFGRVVQHQYRRIPSGRNALSRGVKMPAQDLGFADPRSLRKRYAAFVLAQSWHTSAMLWPGAWANCPSNTRSR